jgi:hypothetical protein
MNKRKRVAWRKHRIKAKKRALKAKQATPAPKSGRASS